MTTSARESAARLADLLRSEHDALADFLVALAHFDHRRLWMDLGYASLFAFLHQHLGLSRGATYYLLTAAQLVQRYPEVVEPLRDGRLCMTSVVELSKVLTPENRAEVLPRFFHLSKRDAQEVAAELRPAEVVPRRTVVAAIASTPQTLALTPANPDEGQIVQPANHPDANCEPRTQEVRPPPPSPPPETVVEPKTAELTRLHITVSRAVVKKLGAARDALSHKLPGATDAQVLEAALDLVLEHAAKRRHLVKTPRKAPPPMAPDSDEIPAHVAREVWLRDGGRCQFPTADGGVCGATYQLELDHIHPKARGGPPTADNLRVACKPHNLHRAREIYGNHWMDRFTTNPRGSSVREPVGAYGTASGEPRYFPPFLTAAMTFGTAQARPFVSAVSNVPTRSISLPPPRAKSCASGPPSTYIACCRSSGAARSAFTSSYTGQGVRAWMNRTRPARSVPIAAAE
jgi:HNH endonuclease